MDFIGFLWNEGLINPMINALIILANVLFDNFGLAIIAFTILIRVAMTPLTLRQFRTTRAMQEMQPQLQEQFNILWQASGWADGSPSFD